MKYFKDCNTLEEVRKLYRKLAFENHPDKGGNTATMQEINKEYAYISAKIISGQYSSAEETDREMNYSHEYREVIEKIINLPDIIIELVAHWIWVTGKTKPVRQQLKEAGFYFASKKEAWYYRSELFKVSRGGRKSLDEIRGKYGSSIINSDSDKNKKIVNAK
ncbi:J domain-containing protein [Sphingobacterium yanglingense]|uniref:J domain-containing protein n=1 Tax=Sphingobacterium yanglingense TaxID=1437280 RepID=A0A4V3DCX3_9SPHI|nr:J domain-containing protein [Sphingobacterium yanglingense]TDQ73833.1 hypothetical protein CLV99_4270 [Sphingobacterium yanglingense]